MGPIPRRKARTFFFGKQNYIIARFFINKKYIRIWNARSEYFSISVTPNINILLRDSTLQ